MVCKLFPKRGFPQQREQVSKEIRWRSGAASITRFFSPNTLHVFHRLRRGRHKAMLGLGSWGMNFDNYFGVDVTTRSRVNKRLGTRLVEGLV